MSEGKKQIVFIIALTLFFSAFLCGVSSAEWISKGPEGADITTLDCSEQYPNMVLAGTNGGIYKTTDAGGSWQYEALRFRRVAAIGGRAECGAGIFAAAYYDVFNSTDNGESWNLNASFPRRVECITMTHSPDCLRYTGTGDGVYVSNGNSGLLGNMINDLAVDSANNVYAAVEENGIYRTTDDGVTWEPVNNGLTSLEVNALKIDGSNRIFAGTAGGGVLLSTDGGASWTAKNNGLPNFAGYPDFYVVISMTKNSGMLYAVLLTSLSPVSGAVYRSADNGDNWSPTNSSINDYIPESMCITPGGALFVGTRVGILKTVDSGASWTDLTDRISAVPFNNSFVEDAGGTLFVGSYSSGIYKSSDGGETWSRSMSSPGGCSSDVESLLIDGLGNMYCTDNSFHGVYKSTDNGATWDLSSNGLPTMTILDFTIYIEPEALAIDENGGIYVALDNGEVYRTVDQAASWSATSGLPFAGDPPEISALIGGPGNTIYAGTSGQGVFRSSDGGSTWEQKNSGLPISADVEKNAFYIDGTTGNVYVGVSDVGGLYRSDDGGENWSFLEIERFGNPECGVQSITMDQFGNLYVVHCYSYVYFSQDRGLTWREISEGLTSPIGNDEGTNVRGVFADSIDNLVVASFSSGMFKSRDFAPPSPDIKANDSDGPVTIPKGGSLVVTVEIAANKGWGANADWWVVADTPFGWYHYNYLADDWFPGQVVTYQGPLFDLGPYEVVNITGLPVGKYRVYFGVDMDMNGSIDMYQIYYDSVVVNITPGIKN